MPYHQIAKPHQLAIPPGAITSPSQWTSWGNQVGNMRFSSADQINVSNVSQLRPIWKYTPSAEAAVGPWQATPLVIDGVMYVNDPSDGAVALDPETGQVLWSFRVPDRSLKMRSLSYWAGDADHKPRLLYGIYDRVYALDPTTGKPILDFGETGKGYIDLRVGMTEGFPEVGWQITSPPAISGNLLFVAGATARWAFTSRGAPVDPRAFDIRTGKFVWRFNLVPRPGQPNFGTWGPEGWQNRTGPSAWGTMAVDEKLGLVYIPIGTVNPVYLGMDRPGDNLYGASVIALDMKTGKYRWHFQTTHHDIWDYDIGAPPALIDITVKGQPVPALVQVTKMGMMFILDRRTGKPVFGVEERPVPQSFIPGEQAARTQPFPIKPPPLVPLGVKRSDLSTVTPESNRGCLDLWDREGMTDSEMYTPTKLWGATVYRPSNGAASGGTYGGVSYSPELGYIFVNTRNSIGWHKVAQDGKGGIRMDGAYRGMSDPGTGLSCANPPWSELVAVNANTGDIAWRRPLGIAEALGEKGLLLGSPGNGGSMATKGGLVFIGATGDARFRAFDAFTGAELWTQRLPGNANSSPMTFIGKSGRQYVLVAQGQSRNNSNLIAFALPRPGEKTLDLKYADPPPVIPSAALPPPTPIRRGPPGAEQAPAADRPVRSAADLPAGAGRDEFVAMCSACHDVSTAVAQRRTSANWQATIDDMRGRGAQGDDATVERVRAYLAATFGMR